MSCFQELPSDKVDQFFTQLFLFDITMPHTQNFLSPITFSQYLDRNQIRTFNPLPIYEEANVRWKQFLHLNPHILHVGARNDSDLDMADTPADNSWCMLIDFFKRTLNVDKIKDLYMKMHYLAHVFRNFLNASSSISSQRELFCIRAVFTQMTGPILYESIVPTPYFFLPVKSYTDATFIPSLQAMHARVETFVTSHTAQSLDTKKLDELRSGVIKKDIHNTLTKVVRHKEDHAAVAAALSAFANVMKIYRIDQDSYEMTDVMLRDKVRSASIVYKLDKLGDQYVEGGCSGDVNKIIDQLLDAWTFLSPPKKQTVFSKISSVFKKPVVEEMDNDIEAIKRTSQLDPS